MKCVSAILTLAATCAVAVDIPIISQETAIAPEATHRFEFGTVPQKDTTVTLEIVARIDFPTLSGSSMFMQVRLNGREVGAAKTRNVLRLLNRPLVSEVAPGLPSTWFDGNKWRVIYAPDFTGGREQPYYIGDPYHFVLDVTDLTNPAAENRLEITNALRKHSGVAKQGGDLVIAELVVRTQPVASPTMAPVEGIEPIINNGRPAAGPAEYRGEVLPGGGFAILVGGKRWEFATALSYPNAGLNRLVPLPEQDASGQEQWQVEVTATADGGQVNAAGPHYRVRRTIRFTPRNVAIADTIQNAAADTALGLLVRHDLDLREHGAQQVRIAGNPDPTINDYHAPANPSIHVADGEIGLGILCEDTVFANQARLYYDQEPSRCGIRTDMLWLAPGGTYTLEWSVYPVASRDYYDFINIVREDRGSNVTVEGAWTFFNPDTILATPVEQLRAQFDRLDINYACYCGGWVDRKHDPKKIGFGTGVMDPYWADFRRRLTEATAKLRQARPGIKVLVYYDSQRDTSDGGPERFQDSWLTNEQGQQLSTNWSGVYSLTHSVVATLKNSYGKAMLEVAARYMDEMGIDGLYWDEMEATGYGAPLITHNLHDGYSCRLNPQTFTIEREIGITALLGEAHRCAVIDLIRDKGGTLMGNGPPLTRKLLDKHVQRMVEIQHNEYWSFQGHLDTPLGYASARMDFGNWLRTLRMATLLVGTRYTYEHEISAYVFPFTPIELYHGYLLGHERIITLHTGAYGWQNDTSLVVCHRFDSNGKHHPADWPTVMGNGETRTRIELAEDEVAILVRVPGTISCPEGTTIRNVTVDKGTIAMEVSGKGLLELDVRGVRRSIPLHEQSRRISVRR